MLLSLVASLVAPASAFCGTFVGAPGAALTNRSSQVVLAREGTRTTLTLVADYTGDLADFAMILPVPAVLGPEDVGLGDPELVRWLEAFGTPRAVAYSCDDLFDLQKSGVGCGYLLGCAAESMVAADPAPLVGEDAADAVTVESAFTAGVYEIVVLSAAESSDLQGWLAANGYEVPRGGLDVLQEYIDAGVYFLAAKVALDAVPEGNVLLPPLRVAYDADTVGLPIRIGTINADGPQEVLIHALTDPYVGGEVGIANYPQVAMEDECLWLGEEGEDMGAWYGRQVERAVEEAGGAGWILEHSADLIPVEGSGFHCDPCTVEPAIPGNSFAPFGIDTDRAHLTRIRMRYDAATAVEDLSLYESGILGASAQLRYVTHAPELEFAFPVCELGWVDDPGECPDTYVAGCTAPIRMSGLGVLLALVALRRRHA